MQPTGEGSKRRQTWSREIMICSWEHIHYRYFIYRLGARSKRRLVAWEGQPHTRRLEYFSTQATTDVFGQIFGNALSGLESERGWLQHEQLIELQFIWSTHLQFKRPISSSMRYYRLRLQLLEANVTQDTEVDYARYRPDRSQFRAQSVRPIGYREGTDILIFRLTTALNSHNRYQLSISDASRDQIGFVHLDAKLWRSTTNGVLNLPIYAANHMNPMPIGLLRLPYLVVRPWKHAQTNSLLMGSFHHFWPTNWPTQLVLRAPVLVDERLGELVGDLLQVEVQTTRDFVPIVWREFGFYTASTRRSVYQRSQLQYVAIETLTYMELRQRRVFLRLNYDYIEFTGDEIFFTLDEVYQSIGKTMGLLVDLKWAGGSDPNHFVDAVLAASAETKDGCGRPLVFSSFYPNICTLLRLKQTAFPVLLRLAGEQSGNAAWHMETDLRTLSFRQAINFAQAADILGTAPEITHFWPARIHTIDWSLQQQQAVFIWGTQLQDLRIARQLKNAGATALIYNDLPPPMWRRLRPSVFAAKELSHTFSMQCAILNNNSSNNNDYVNYHN